MAISLRDKQIGMRLPALLAYYLDNPDIYIYKYSFDQETTQSQRSRRRRLRPRRLQRDRESRHCMA